MDYRYSVLVREAHLDTFGHVNNATYLALFEEARWQLVTERGYGLEQVRLHKKGPVILEVNLKFISELHLREQIQITVEPLSYTKKIAQMKQKMLKADGTVAAEALFTFGFFDLVTRKLILPTQEWMHAIGWVS